MRRRRARLASAAVALLGAVAVWLVATRVFPHHSLNHDEGVYLQQAAMLLDGRLFLHPPLEDVFRPWFFVDADDQLYPKYSPVPAAIFALGGAVGAWRLALVAVAAAALWLVAAVARELARPPAGVLAAAFVLASPLFLVQASVFLPYVPTMLLNLVFAYGYLRADRTGSVRWAAVAGAGIGLAFVARPFTAVLFASPFVAHALWTLHRDGGAALPRQAATAALGLAGVGAALGYNAVVTGDPLLFPYSAFAPLDGPGFGLRRLVGHEVVYTPELALRANARVLALFVTDWIAGGALGAALAAGGLVAVLRRGPSSRHLAVLGLFVSVPAGNLLFWGNLNVLGDIERAGDGLVAAVGPYYHVDLLLPTAFVAAVGALHLGRWLRGALHARLGRREARVATAAALAVGLVAFGAATAAAGATAFDENLEATATYERAYAPFDAGPPEDSAILLPDPYGDWLNHPFQPLRNDPGFDGRAVYALDDRPFDVADAYPDRDLYRYGYRGAWAPPQGSPEAARLQRVRDVASDRVRLDATLGVPDGAEGVTLQIDGGAGREYVAVAPRDGSVALTATASPDRARLAAPGGGNGSVPRAGDEVVIEAFVDYGAAGGFSYRLAMPVERTDGRIRALSPVIERCLNPRRCGGAATHVPSTAPDGVAVDAELTAPPMAQVPGARPRRSWRQTRRIESPIAQPPWIGSSVVSPRRSP